MTNYEMLINRDAVANEIGEDFAREWYDAPSYYWKRDPFGYGSADNTRFFAAARKMHEIWVKAWEDSKRDNCSFYNHITFDFGWWLFKQADVALLVPYGVAVSTPDGKIGVVTGKHILSGNYALEKVWVDFASGVSEVDPKDIRKANIPQSLMEYAKAAAMKELKDKCPLTKEG